MTLVSFFAVCAATAFVCTVPKEDDGPQLAASSARLLGWLAAGIGAFALAIQFFTFLAG